MVNSVSYNVRISIPVTIVITGYHMSELAIYQRNYWMIANYNTTR